MCVCVCVGGGLCNVVIEFHVHMNSVTLIKIYVNESCNKVRIGKTLSCTFPVQNCLNQRMKVTFYGLRPLLLCRRFHWECPSKPGGNEV